jgi:hypothetical protein
MADSETRYADNTALDMAIKQKRSFTVKPRTQLFPTSASPKRNRTTGNAEYVPTADQRTPRLFGITQADIAEQLKIDEKTLRTSAYYNLIIAAYMPQHCPRQQFLAPVRRAAHQLSSGQSRESRRGGGAIIRRLKAHNMTLTDAGRNQIVNQY